jgi:hypothetical protein
MEKESLKCSGRGNAQGGDVGAFASCLLSVPPVQFTALATLLGILLIEHLDLDQQNALGNFIVGVGQTMLVAAAQGQLLQPDSAGSNDIDMQQLIQGMKMQLEALEKRANKK